MAQPDDIEARVSALESQVSELTTQVRRSARDAAAARVLAGGADRDVTEIREEIRDFRRATTSSFNAMRADLTDLRADLTDLRGDMTDLRGDMTDLQSKVEKGFTEIRGRLDATAAGHQQIVDLLNTLIAGQDNQPDR